MKSRDNSAAKASGLTGYFITLHSSADEGKMLNGNRRICTTPIKVVIPPEHRRSYKSDSIERPWSIPQLEPGAWDNMVASVVSTGPLESDPMTTIQSRG